MSAGCFVSAGTIFGLSSSSPSPFVKKGNEEEQITPVEATGVHRITRHALFLG